MAVSNPFSLGGTGQKTAGGKPLGSSSWLTAQSPEYQSFLGHTSNDVSGGPSQGGPLDWNRWGAGVNASGTFNPFALGFEGQFGGQTTDPSGEGDTQFQVSPEFQSWATERGYQPGMLPGVSGGYASPTYGLLGQDQQPVAGSEWRAPVDKGSDFRDLAFNALALYGAGSGLNAAINGAGAGAAAGGTATTGAGPASAGAQTGSLSTMGQVAVPELAATAAAPTATVGGSGAASGITAQQAMQAGGAVAGAGGAGGGSGQSTPITSADYSTELPAEFGGVQQTSGANPTGDPTRAALYGDTGYGAGMTGAETGPAGGSSFQMPEWLSSFGQQFGGDAQKLFSQLLLARGVQAMGPNAPATPDYGQLANQQTASNQQTAEFNANLNRVNTTTPMGSQTFNRVADPTAPGGYRYESDIQFSPEQQALYRSETANQQAMQDLAGQMQGRVGAGLQNPFSLSGAGEAGRVNSDPNAFSAERDQVTQALYDRMTRTREPAMERAREQLDTRLKNQGLMPGTEAYDNAMQTMLEAQSSELQDLTSRAIEAGGAEQTRLNNALLANTGFNNQTRSQGIQELLLERQQPLTEFNSLRTGNTPTLPTFQPFGFSQAAPTNTMAPAQMQYGANVDQYNARVGQYQNLLNFLTKGSGS